jgi:hypothetical protein
LQLIYFKERIYLKIKDTFFEVIYGVFPIAIIITILQFTIVKMPLDLYLNFIGGALLVIIGLVLFLAGIESSFVPIGESFGNSLVKSGNLRLILLFGFIIGFAVTLPEPDVQVFVRQVTTVVSKISGIKLLVLIALGVGISVLIAFLRIFLNIHIKYFFIVGYVAAFILLIFCPSELRSIAFDVGGVTTGSLTVPFVMSLGVGVSSMIARKNTTADGFGILAIASIGPIIAVLIMGVIAK